MSFLKDIADAGKKQIQERVKQTVKQKKENVKQQRPKKETEIEIDPFIDWEKIAKSSEFKRLIYLAITGKPTRDSSRVITLKLNNIKKHLTYLEKEK